VQLILGIFVFLVSCLFLSSIGTEDGTEIGDERNTDFYLGCAGMVSVFSMIILELSALYRTKETLDKNPMLRVRGQASTRKFGHNNITDDLAGACGLV